MENLRFKDYLKDYLIDKNITNKDFANRIGITEKHLIKILKGEIDLSANIINNISLVTGISKEYIYKMEDNYKIENDINEYLKRNNITLKEYLNNFNYKYLLKTNYINFKNKNKDITILKDILFFLRVPSIEKIYEIDENIYYKSKNDKVELLLLWLEKCYKETLKQTIGKYDKNNIRLLVDYILSEAKQNEFNKEKLIKEFNKYGIYLVIEEDIPGSKIRGAFKVHRGKPAIYITYKHKRLADIYFALLHELAHLKSDYNKAQKTNLVDFIDDKEETERDNQAFDWMVNNKYYYDNYINKNYDIENEKNYPKSFIVYRLANDKKIKYNSKIFQEYNKVINNLPLH